MSHHSDKAPISTKPLVVAARGQRPKRQPIWFMRQAGRYLPEYMAVRSRVDFLELCRTPTLAAEVTLQPLRRYDLDAAIIFADILLPCIAMGQTLSFDKGHGPRLASPIRDMAGVRALKTAGVAKDLSYVGEALSLTRQGLRPEQALLGFAGAPFTVASYMVEGSGTKSFTEIKRMAYRQPETLAALLQRISEATRDYLAMQVEAGADALMLFDTWAGQLPSDAYRRLVVPTMKQLITEVKALGVPVIYYPGQGADQLYELGPVGADVVSIDWRTPLDRAVQILNSIGVNATVQGNLDPLYLQGDEVFVRERTREVLARGKKARAHIFNVGHGLVPETPPEALTWVIDEVRRDTGG